MLSGTQLEAIQPRGQGPVAMTARERAQALSQVSDLLMQAQARLCSIPDPAGADFQGDAMGFLADTVGAISRWSEYERAKLA